MFYLRFLVGSILLCIVLVSDLDARQMSLEEDLTVLIDYEKYQEHVQPWRHQRQLNASNHTQPLNLQQVQQKRNDSDECNGSNECETKVCDDPENEVYQECGSKCVLGCRYASISSGFSFTISKHDCEKNDCVEGCFCKTGLVRHQTKCIPASECPVRKCNHRYEVYMCGPAAPITCDNALREDEISELTRHVECVWGCFCAQGYLRNNYNGKCVPEQECRNTKSVDISPQIPGLFKHITGGGRGCGPKGCGSHHHSSSSSSSSSSEENECGPTGCGSTESHEIGCGSNGCDNEGQWNNGNRRRPIDNRWQSGPAPVIHVHKWNGTCIGTNVCTGADSGSGNRGTGSVNSDTPLTTVTLQNGTTITSPAGSEATVNLDAIQTGADIADEEEEEYDDEDYEHDTVEEDDDDDTDMPMETRPQIPDSFATAITNAIAESQKPSSNEPQNDNSKPQSVPSAEIMNGNSTNTKPQIMPVPSLNVNTPINNAPSGQSTHTPMSNGNNFMPRPPQLAAISFPNYQLPNNAIQNPITNPFGQFNYPITPNFIYNPNIAQNMQQFTSPFFGSVQKQQQQAFVPPNFFNRPIVPNRIQIANAPTENKYKVETEYDSVEELESEEYEKDTASKKTEMKVPLNNQQPFINLFNPNQYVPNQYQINPNQFNPYHFNPNQFQPNPFYINNLPNGYPTHFSSPNVQFNPFSNNNPFNAQSTNAPLNQANLNYSPHMNKQGNPISQKQKKKPHKKQQSTGEKQTPAKQFNTFNRKIRPFSDKPDADEKIESHINGEQMTENSNDKIPDSEKMRYIQS